MLDNLGEKCGIFGVFAPGDDVARLTFFGLHALQHRGQESAGIATTDGRRLHLFADMGLVSQVFDEEALAALTGHAAIGHTRYSTTGSSTIGNAQPFHLKGQHGELAIAHNGNVVNADVMREELLDRGLTFETSSDTEVLGRILIDGDGEDWNARFAQLMRRANGAYSLTILTHDAVYAVRDPLGIRPLSIGRLNGHGYILASETCALDHLGAEFLRDVRPGEVVRIDRDGLTSSFPLGEPLVMTSGKESQALCLFEFTYFARPDSRVSGQLLHPVRGRMGARLSEEHPVEADLVIGVPDSATAAAIGYARASGIPYAEGLVKNRYVGRTFIQPDQRIRERGVQMKFNPLREVLEGKRVVVVDDSIVRGTTTPHVVKMLRDAGALEVHMRITAPPITHPCFYGVDMATRGELIAANMSLEEIREYINADSLGYLSLEGTIWATNLGPGQHCTACFSGQYPSEVPLQFDKFALEDEAQRPDHEIPRSVPEPVMHPLSMLQTPAGSGRT
ncbi:MAG: amidophosphoribosyltransferase [Dehalococcoidia bacterium]|nr:amidophosphoribosyltransferase [Dehalococcoidia bacterium]